MKIAYIFFAICMIVGPLSEIAKRKGMDQVGNLNSFADVFSLHTLWKVITNPYVVAGVILSILLTIFWLATLSHWNASYLFPMGSISQVVVLVLAVVMLQEKVTVPQLLGVGTIIIGITLLNWKPGA